MKKNNRQFKLTGCTPALSTKLTDAAGNPSESYNWRHMAEVRCEWQYEFQHPYVNTLEPAATEIRSIETRVRRELYS